MSKLMEVSNILAEAGLIASQKKPDDEEGRGINGEGEGQGDEGDEGQDILEGEGDEGEGDEGEGDEGEGDEGEGDDGQGEEHPKLKLSEAAEKLGIKARELYDQLQVPMGGDQVMTLGALKDLASEGKKALAEIAEIRDTSDNASRELMLQRADLTKAAELLAPFLKPEQQEALAELNKLQTQREVKLLMGALPAWKNQDTAKKELGRMHKVAAAYGISATELDVLVQDHRLVRLLRDVAMRETGIKPKKLPPKPGGRHTPNKPDDTIRRAQAPGASKADKLAAINKLIGA